MNITNKNKCALPMFFVDLFPQNNNKNVLNITSLLNNIVVIEKPHKTCRGPPQCQQCQNYSHTKNRCHHIPRCVKCSEDHFPRNTQKTKTAQPNAPSVLVTIRPITKAAQLSIHFQNVLKTIITKNEHSLSK